MQLLMLGEAEVQGLLDPIGLLDALAESFKALSENLVVAPKRSEVTVPEKGFLLTMPAYQRDHEITVKLVSIFHGNEELGLPSHQALICLFDAQTGLLCAIMDGTSITALRTAGAAALSTRLLARPESSVLAIVGAGVQGRAHLKLLPLVRAFSEIRIASHSFANAERLAAIDIRARAFASVEEAVDGADVICLCTSASKPVLKLAWLAPGAHVTSVGYRPPGGELDSQIIERSRLFVETRLAFEPAPAGCAELAGFAAGFGTELGELLLGQRPGRQGQHELTLYKAMGHACEDMAAASLVYQRARQEGAGRVVEL
ncbi:MAG TPA: ornithine cyclodeaminase family protein [Ktedonobacteraceae bacterium]